MTVNDFIEKIENGSDIMFDVVNRHFTILTWLDEGIGIGEQNSNEPLSHFDSAEELLKNYKVGGFTLEQLCEQIVITDYS